MEFLLHTRFWNQSGRFTDGETTSCPRTILCLVVSQVGSLTYTHRSGTCLIVLVGREFLLHAPCWILSCYSSSGESILHVPGWNQSRHSEGGEFLLHAPCWNPSDRSADGEFLLHAPCWNPSCYLLSGESVLHVQCYYQSRRSVGGEFLLHAPCWSPSDRSAEG